MSTSNTEPVLPLPVNPSPDARTFVSASLWFVDHDGYRVVFCRHDPIYRIALDDLPHLRYVSVMLRQSELATQEELAHAFGHSVASQRRWERHYQQHGLDGLVNQFSSGRPRKLDNAQSTLSDAGSSRGFPKPRSLDAWASAKPRSTAPANALACSDLPLQSPNYPWTLFPPRRRCLSQPPPRLLKRRFPLSPASPSLP